MPMLQGPYPLAIIICDSVHTDPTTRKQTLFGMFSTIGGASFPVQHPAMAVFLSLTDGLGEVSLRMRLVDADEEMEQALFEHEVTVEWTDPRMVLEMSVNLNGIMFPKEGEYRFQVFVGEDLVPISERRLVLMNVEDRR